MRLVSVALVAAFLISCRDRGGSGTSVNPPPPSPPTAVPYLLVPSEATAYRRGREREIALLRDAIARHRSITPVSSLEAGATAAGLSPDAYERLVTRVDSGLRLRTTLAARDSAGPARAEWAELDSLRVELAVLRSRLDALGSGTP